MRLARALYRLAERDTAKELLQRMASLNGGVSPAELLYADIAFSAGDHAAVEQMLPQLKELAASTPAIRIWLAEWYLIHGDLQQAETTLEQVQASSEKTDRFWVPRGQIDLLKGEYAVAIESFRRAIKQLQERKELGRLAAIEHYW